MRERHAPHLGDGAEVAVGVVAHDDCCSEDGNNATESERFSEKIGEVAENYHHGALEHREHENAAVPAADVRNGRV